MSLIFPKYFQYTTHSLHTHFKIILVTGVEEQCYFLLKTRFLQVVFFCKENRYCNKQPTHSFCIRTSSICTWIPSEFSECLRLQCNLQEWNSVATFTLLPLETTPALEVSRVEL